MGRPIETGRGPFEPMNRRMMPRAAIWALLTGLWVILPPGQVFAQSPSPASGGRVIPTPANGAGLAPSPLPSAVGSQPAVPAEVKAQLEKFQAARDAYLQKQHELAQQLQGATDAQRKLLRDQLQTLRREWLEKSIQFRREITDRIPSDVMRFDLLNKAKPAAVEGPVKRDRRLN